MYFFISLLSGSNLTCWYAKYVYMLYIVYAFIYVWFCGSNGWRKFTKKYFLEAKYYDLSKVTFDEAFAMLDEILFDTCS